MERSTQANTKAFIAVFDEIYFWTSSFLSLSLSALFEQLALQKGEDVRK